MGKNHQKSSDFDEKSSKTRDFDAFLAQNLAFWTIFCIKLGFSAPFALSCRCQRSTVGNCDYCEGDGVLLRG